MKLTCLFESQIHTDKIDLLIQRKEMVNELPLKLSWISQFGGSDLSQKANEIYQKIYQDLPPKIKGSKSLQILLNNEVWLDINNSWFLTDLKRIIPKDWQTPKSPNYQLTQALERYKNHSDLPKIIVQILTKLSYTDARKEIGPLISKHILPEVFA